MSNDYSYEDVQAIIAALPNSPVELPIYNGGVADSAYLKSYVTALLTDTYGVPASVFDHATLASTTLIRDFLNRALLFQDDRVARSALEDLGLTISTAFEDVASLLRYPAAGSCGDHSFQLYQIFKAFGFDCAWIDATNDISSAYLTSHATTIVMVEDLDKWIVQDSYENFLFRGQDGAFLSYEEARILAALDPDNVVFDGMASYLEYPELGYGRNITPENQILVKDDLFSLPSNTVYTLNGVQYVHSFTGGFSNLANPYDSGSDQGGVFVDVDAALAAAGDLLAQGLTWQAAANVLRADYYVSGFTLNPGDGDASQWLTVRLADGNYVSINYGDGSYLYGSLEQLLLLAGTGNFPAGSESFANDFLGASYTLDSAGYVTADWGGAALIRQNSRPGAEASLQFVEPDGSVPLSSVFQMTDDDGDTATFVYIEVIPSTGGAYLMSPDGETFVSGGRTLNARELAEWRLVPGLGGSTSGIQLRVSDGIAWSDPFVLKIGTIDSAADVANQFDWATRSRFEYDGQRYGEAYSLDDGGARTIEYDVRQANPWSERWVESDDLGATRYIKTIFDAGGGRSKVETNVDYTLTDADQAVDISALSLTSTNSLHLVGNIKNNILAGNAGANTLDGGGGNDTLRGYDGDDIYIVREAGDVVVEVAGEGIDTIETTVSFTLAAGVSIEVLRTLDANATTALDLTGNELDNRLEGNAGSNRLDGGGGSNVLAGAAGDDFYIVRGPNDVVAEAVGEGFDTVTASASYTLAAGAAVELLRTSAANATTALSLTGNELDNRLEGNAGANTLDGGGGNDVLAGGRGDDSYIVRSANDVVVEAGGEGFDTIKTIASYTLASGVSVELLRTLGSSNGAAIDLTGNELDNILAGNAAGNTLDGGAGRDTLWGYLGDDIYIVREADDALVEVAGEGFDTVKTTVSYTLAAGVSIEVLRTLDANATTALNLTGNELDNRLEGNAGSNVLDGGGGSNVLAGGGGYDFYIVRGPNDAVVEAAYEGFDTVTTTTSYVLAAGAEIELLRTANAAATTALNLTGNVFDNRLEGNAGANTLDGGGGSDVLSGGQGDDTYIVRNSNDVVIEGVGAGFDTIIATTSYTLAAGASVEVLRTVGSSNGAVIDLVGNELDNILAGNAAGNLLDGGAGRDTLWGYGGDDIYIVRSAGDVVVEVAGQGFDIVKATTSYTLGAGVSVELLRTLDANATTALDLTGNELDNRLEGNAGSNVLNGAGGSNVLAGGGGDDFYIVRGAGDLVLEAMGEGFDTVTTTTSYTLAAGASVELLRTSDANAATALNLTGNGQANRLEGNAGVNTLDGGGGGNDVLAGGRGDDTYIVRSAGDVVIEGAGEGFDTIITTASYTLAAGASIELLRTIGSSNGALIDLTGNELDNILSGNAAGNLLDGGAGRDTLWGYGGDDIYIVREANDVVVEVAGEGFDTIRTTASYTLGIGVSIEVLRTLDANATTALNLTGNELGNRLEGNAGSNLLDGGGGSNVLAGAAGDDGYFVRGANDVVIELAGEGFDTVTTTASYTLGTAASIELLRTSDANATIALSLTGSALSNRLEGNAGANTLDGGAGGNDVLVGGRGDDSYIVRTASDVVIEAAGEGFDTVFAGASYTLAAGVSVELLRTAGGSSTFAAIDLIGNELNNVLAGNAAGNLLDGGAGTDTLWGYGGDDVYIIRSANDVVVEAAGGGMDTVKATVSYVLGAGVSVELLRTLDAGATTALNLTGNEFDNQIEGNAGNNVLDGGGGGNVLIGYGGEDSFVLRFDQAADSIVDFASGEDRLLLDLSSFGLHQTGTLAEAGIDFLELGASGQAGAALYYDAAGGKIFWDSDGAGAAEMVEIASLGAGTLLSGHDFFVV